MDLESAKKLYRTGLSIRKISSRLRVPRETLRIELAKSGLIFRKSRKDKAISYHNPQFKISTSSAELIAMHAGDGGLDVNGNWTFTSFYKDLNLICRVRFLIRNVVGVEPGTYRRENRIIVASGQRQTQEYFSRYFPMGKKSNIVKIPRGLYCTRNQTILKSVLIGLYSTDGSFSLRKTGRARVEFRVRSKELRNQFLKISQRLGFRLNESDPISNGRPIYTTYTEDQKQIKRWMKTIGSRCDTHNERYEKWLQAGVP